MKNRKFWIVILSILFLILSILIKLDLLQSFDTFCYSIVTFKMNNFLTIFHKFWTFLGSTVFIIIASILLFCAFLFKKRHNHSYLIASSIIISTVFNNVVKLIIRRDRPEVLKLVVENSFSFPSGHTMASVTLYGILFYIVLRSNLDKKIKIPLNIILFLIPFFVGISRIYLGAHFASDILGGFLLSTIILLVITYYVDKKNII